MAKNASSFIKLQGTISDLCFVRSRAYGAHVRVARGTVKKAVCNETLTRNHQRTKLLNETARPVYAALKQCGGSLCEGQLWQRILSRLRGGPANDPAGLMQQLAGLEINRLHSFSKLLAPGEVEISFTKLRIKVSFGGWNPPAFKKIRDDGCYRFEVTVLYPDPNSDTCKHYSRITEWIPVREEVPHLRLTVLRPQQAKLYLLCLKLEGLGNPSSVDSFVARGMQVVRAGEVKSLL